MDEHPFFSPALTWLDPSEEIVALNGKSVLFIDNEVECECSIRVFEPGEHHPESGRVSVSISSSWSEPVAVRPELAEILPPTTAIRSWSKNLTASGVAALRANTRDYKRGGELILDARSPGW